MPASSGLGHTIDWFDYLADLGSPVSPNVLVLVPWRWQTVHNLALEEVTLEVGRRLGAMLDAIVASAGTRENTEMASMASLVRRGDCIGRYMSVPCAAAGAPLKFVLARCLVDAVLTVPRSGVLSSADSRFSATVYPRACACGRNCVIGRNCVFVDSR